jgi:hypothetical protein
MDDGAKEQHASPLAIFIPLHNGGRAWWQWSRKESVHEDGRSYPHLSFYPCLTTIFKPPSVQRYSGAAKFGKESHEEQGKVCLSGRARTFNHMLL